MSHDPKQKRRFLARLVTDEPVSEDDVRKALERALAGLPLVLESVHSDDNDEPPCGGSRCHRADDGTWIHSSKSYGTCSERGR